MYSPDRVALRVVNHISAMVAYWDADQRCIFANEAYREWFGRSPEQIVGLTMKQLLGPELYAKNEPYIRGVLAGERQVFERQIPLPGGGSRESIATYTPDILFGQVKGFSVHVADVSGMKERERLLVQTLKERDEALAEVNALRGLLPICAGCKSIRDSEGAWQPLERYVSERADVSFSHGMCPECCKKYFPDVTPPRKD